MKLPKFSLTEALRELRQHPPIDAAAMQRTLGGALERAGLGAGANSLKAASDTVRRALADAGLVPGDTVVERAGPRGGPVVQDADPAVRGHTLSGVHVGLAGRRSYRLYVPPEQTDRPRPLLVMLHGCTQSPEDFAAGTRMNAVADRDGFLVVYPAQSANANGSKCWNWYRAQDQVRDGGEPALIAGIVRDVVAAHAVDSDRIFVAGLSAGGAMAVILGQTYPDLFKGIGVHSGLPYGAAHDMPSAFAAMGADPRGSASTKHRPGPTVPTIVFHGDRDHTVNAGNGDVVVAQALAGGDLAATVLEGSTPSGQRWTRTVHRNRDGRAIVEQWVVHGAGHAWSGGSAAGSYTAPGGPDASTAMAEFFLAGTLVGTAR